MAPVVKPDYRMRYEYISWNRFYRLCGVLFGRITASGFAPDLIVAITRGGYPAARVLADFQGLMDLVGLKIEHYRGPTKQADTVVPYPLPLSVDGRRVLLVDDVSDSGDTSDAAFGEIARHGEPAAIRTAVLHHKQTSRHVPDYCAQRVRQWRWITYPWALVEDLTQVVAGMTPIPTDAPELVRRVAGETGLRPPQSVLEAVAPIVLQRLAAVRPSVGH
jgi:hypoxanthine phosphoribosyltransferase